LVRGVSGSGKSTLAKKLWRDSCVGGEFGGVYEADQFFLDGTQTEYRFDAKFLPYAHQWCLAQVARAVMFEDDVIVSNTFTQYWEIEKYLKLAKANGYKVHMIHCTGEYQNVHGVPASKVQEMKDRFHSNEAVYLQAVDDGYGEILKYE
jgi:predicted kinase